MIVAKKIESVYSLLKQRTYTADALARQLKCSRPAAERRILEVKRLLKGTKRKVQQKYVRTGERGPATRAYFIE
jgi:hypothetical protein